MIFLKTVYPCRRCQDEIDPNTPYCPNCSQPQDHSSEEHFNIFRDYRGNGVYNATYGSTILTYEDIAELAEENLGIGYFIGAFIPANQSQNGQVNLTRWIPIINGEPGPDQGSYVIEITNLE